MESEAPWRRGAWERPRRLASEAAPLPPTPHGSSGPQRAGDNASNVLPLKRCQAQATPQGPGHWAFRCSQRSASRLPGLRPPPEVGQGFLPREDLLEQLPESLLLGSGIPAPGLGLKHTPPLTSCATLRAPPGRRASGYSSVKGGLLSCLRE